MSEDEKNRLVNNIAGGLSQVGRDDVIEKNLAHFHAADPDYGKRVEEASARCARTEPLPPGPCPVPRTRMRGGAAPAGRDRGGGRRQCGGEGPGGPLQT